MTKPYPKLSLSMGKPLDVSPLCGNWVNTDHSSAAGMLGLTVTEDNGSLWVRGLGMAKPVAYDWPRVRAGSYASNPTSGEAWSFLAEYDFGFMRTVISAYCKLGILITTTYNLFSDGSERTDYWTREFFHRRSLGGPPPSTPPPPGISRGRDRRDAPAHGAVDPATMIGRWVNFDRNAPGITEVTVSGDPGRLAVVVGELGPHGIRRWPEVPVFVVAENTGGGPAIGFVASGDLFGERSEGPHTGTLCAYLNRGLLTVDTHVADFNGQAHTMTRTHLHLAEEATA
jgi:hypothetical protein